MPHFETNQLIQSLTDLKSTSQLPIFCDNVYITLSLSLKRKKGTIFKQTESNLHIEL